MATQTKLHFCPLPNPPRFSGSSGGPPYQKPHLLHTYRHLPSREIDHDAPPLAYHTPQPIGCDLNNGFAQRIERDPRLQEHLDGLCEGLIQFVRRKGSIKDGALITWRGMLTRLLTAAFNDRDGWEMNALALDGNVYLEDHVTEEAIDRKIAQDNNSALFSYYGYAFEAYSTLPAPPKAPEDCRTRDWEDDMNINTNEQWCCIVKSKIGNTRLYMGGEVDCVEGEWNRSMSGCVELKTNMLITDGRGQANFERKLLKHWAQSMLLGVPKIEVGFRDRRGILQQVQAFGTQRIPSMVLSRNLDRPPWTAVTCLKTFDALANFIAETILPTDPIPEWQQLDLRERMRLPEPVMWRITFQPGNGLELRQLGRTCEPSEDRWGFLSKSYVQELVDAP